MVQTERIHPLNKNSTRPGDYVLYWMQAAQRAEDNHALEFAIGLANDAGRPLVVFFGLTGDFPEANARSYDFMLRGLRETRDSLTRRGIPLVVRLGPPPAGAADLGRHASLVVVDDGYLRVERRWRSEAASALPCPLIEVATNVVVPPDSVSSKEEYSAATLRPKILRSLEKFLVPLKLRALRKDSLGLALDSSEMGDTGSVLSALGVDRGVAPVADILPGPAAARKRLREFIRSGLAGYAIDRNDPSKDGGSKLSPYLHFGQISPLTIALEVRKAPPAGQPAFLEQLIVRRELAVNFVLHNPRYDRFDGLPAWCRETLLAHAADRRPYLYGAGDLERAETHDPYWNAAQKEMTETGRMHGYMRMYWGKKILEWSASPRQAFRTALRLNNRYQLDGRDPNGFAGVAWCFGQHDRPWGTRPVFGTVRSMTEGGLRRKFDIEAYVRRVERAAAIDNSEPLAL